ncbi:unnamed protein product [Aphanomyces euteiches]|uniref:Uncharacterized protein n=1 Tax=Aphanomyces euteiches TaxID=100861 RepID=A0A6G0XBH6_9STRA|nr:hypothetical protein Ae201684_006676 [Aphanomyces euteiches]KAH9090789.1 hypothetical protein Ae201684P_006194 [Aphanomyces euteiches]KAH9136814.1 hypothetical protein AeRB84_018221 [Aphanomyces euteiches]
MSGHSSPLFTSPSKRGAHHTPTPFTTTEARFKWQESNANSDALYKLPGTLGGPMKSFGTSTRDDWDRRKKAGSNLGAYEAPKSCGKQVSSVTRTASELSFNVASRTPLRDNTTPSPGPIYNLPGAFDNKVTNAFSMGSSLRPNLHGGILGPGPTTAQPGPGTPPKYASPCVTSTFGSEKRMRPATVKTTPGPIYDVECTGFQTGPKSSFSVSQRF